MKRTLSAAALVLMFGTTAPAHRLDEYLQGTILSVQKNRIQASMTLTPGVAVFPFVLADLDADRNGSISASEQQAYARRVLRDLKLTLDTEALPLHLATLKFPAIEDMKEGRGEIRIEYEADLPTGGGDRKLTLENHHQTRISAYQVNCLISTDPDIKLGSQIRNYSQSSYELNFKEAGVQHGRGIGTPMWIVGLGLFALITLLRQQSHRTNRWL